nr:RHS repeat-associated core domain-containing protein [Pseudomonas sp. B21-023]
MTTIRDRQQSNLLAIDSSASVVGYADHHVSYTPHGYKRQVRMSGIAFKGQHLDAATERYPLGNGYRFYSPILMRFCSPDSESPFRLGGVNIYAFVSGDPVNGADPTGHFNWTKMLKLLGKDYGGKGQVIDGIMVFYSEQPDQSGETVLNVLTHGQPGLLLGDELGYTPDRLKTLLEDNGISLKGQKTHVMACYSAAALPSGGASFIQEWSNITGAQTTGYMKGVPTPRSVDGDNHHAVVLPVLPVFKQLLSLSSKPISVEPSDTLTGIRSDRPAGRHARR